MALQKLWKILQLLKLFLDASCIKKIKSMTQMAIIWTKVTSGQLSNQSDTPRRKLSYYQYLANIFILPILGKYCKFYQYWARLRRKAICRSQKLRQHILSIAFLSLVMSSAVRNCPCCMRFFLSRTSRWHCPPVSSCMSASVHNLWCFTRISWWHCPPVSSCMSALQPWGGYGGGRNSWGMARPPVQGDTRLRYIPNYVIGFDILFSFLLFSSFLKIDQAW